MELRPYPLPAAQIAPTSGVPDDQLPIWCGRAEGWLMPGEFLSRTRADIDRYAAAQPLRFRQAMRRARLHFPIKRSRR